MMRKVTKERLSKIKGKLRKVYKGLHFSKCPNGFLWKIPSGKKMFSQDKKLTKVDRIMMFRNTIVLNINKLQIKESKKCQPMGKREFFLKH